MEKNIYTFWINIKYRKMNHILHFSRAVPNGGRIFSVKFWAFFQKRLGSLSAFIYKIIQGRLWRMNWVVWLLKETPDGLKGELWLTTYWFTKKRGTRPPLTLSVFDKIREAWLFYSQWFSFNLCSYVHGNYFKGLL